MCLTSTEVAGSHARQADEATRLGVFTQAGVPELAAPGGAEVLARVQGVVTGILGTAAAPDQPLMEAGLDSIGAAGSGARAGCGVFRCSCAARASQQRWCRTPGQQQDARLLGWASLSDSHRCCCTHCLATSKMMHGTFGSMHHADLSAKVLHQLLSRLRECWCAPLTW